MLGVLAVLGRDSRYISGVRGPAGHGDHLYEIIGGKELASWTG